MSMLGEPFKKLFGIEIKFRKGKIQTEVSEDVVEAGRAAFVDYGEKNGIPAAVSLLLWAEALRALRVKVV